MRIILGASRIATGTEMQRKLEWTILAQRRKLHVLIKVADKCIQRSVSAEQDLISLSQVPEHFSTKRQTYKRVILKQTIPEQTKKQSTTQLQNFGPPKHKDAVVSMFQLYVFFPLSLLFLYYYVIVFFFCFPVCQQCCIQKMWLGGNENFQNVGGRRCL